MQRAGSARQFVDEFAGQDFGALFIITRDASFNLPTPAYCDQVRNQNNLNMPVLMDDGTAGGLLGILPANRDADFVLAPGGRIALKLEGNGSGTSQGINQDDVRPTIQNLLAQ